MPSTGKNNLLIDKIEVQLNDISYAIDVYDTPLGHRWIDALRNNLGNKRILEKNFCFLGFADSKRDLRYLVRELNKNITQINSFEFDPPYEKIHPFVTDDFQYSGSLPIGKSVNGDQSVTPGKRLKHETCNLLHRYFEDLQGEAWGLSNYYKIADSTTKYAIRQLNDLCHELESYVLSYRKSKFEPEWQRPSQINTWLQAPRSDLSDEDYKLFLENKFDRTCGGVYLHWAQIGKTHIEVFRDEDGKDVDDIVCSSISALKYYSGEFDIEWGKDITEHTAPWLAQEQLEFRTWLQRNGFDETDPKLALGFIKIGQCNLMKSFGTTDPIKIWSILAKHLDVFKITIDDVTNTFDYVWSQPNFKQKQIKIMEPGYVWSSQH